MTQQRDNDKTDEEIGLPENLEVKLSQRDDNFEEIVALRDNLSSQRHKQSAHATTDDLCGGSQETPYSEVNEDSLLSADEQDAYSEPMLQVDCLVGGSLETIDEKSKSELERSQTIDRGSAVKSAIRCFMCGEHVPRAEAGEHAKNCDATSAVRSQAAAEPGVEPTNFSAVKRMLDQTPSVRASATSESGQDWLTVSLAASVPARVDGSAA